MQRLVMPSEGEFKERLKQLREASGKDIPECCKLKVVPEDYGIAITSDVIPYLTDEEKARLETVQEQKNIEFYQPRVIRFMDEQYIDQFLDNGTLMLSTYGRCHRLDDSTRKDTKDGCHDIVGEAKSGLKVSCGMGVGSANLMLCATLNQSNVVLDPNTGKSDIFTCALQINKPAEFAAAIGNTLNQHLRSGLQGVAIGPCFYSDGPLTGTIPESEKHKFSIDGNTSCEDIFQMIGELSNITAGTSIFFHKRLSKSFEQEYRFVWITGQNKLFVDGQEKDHVIMQFPDAIQFCEKKIFKNS